MTSPSDTPPPIKTGPGATNTDPPVHPHDWIVQASIHVDEKTAKHANLRLSFRATEGQRIEALEVICHGCRRPYDDVAGQPCAALINNEHLRGGPIGERKKRNVLDPNRPGITMVAGPKINRWGVKGYVSGDAGRM